MRMQRRCWSSGAVVMAALRCLLDAKSGPVQEYKTIFEKMMMEEALALVMQGSESAEILLPQPAVIVSAAQVLISPSLLTRRIDDSHDA